VRYALNAAPLLAHVCRCHNCQTRTGAAFTLTLVIRTADLAVEGEPVWVLWTSASGGRTDHAFCPACRVPMFIEGARRPRLHEPAGRNLGRRQ
jgi:hypothetical protein